MPTAHHSVVTLRYEGVATTLQDRVAKGRVFVADPHVVARGDGEQENVMKIVALVLKIESRKTYKEIILEEMLI